MFTSTVHRLVFIGLAACGTGAFAQSQSDIVKMRASLSILDNDNFFSAPAANAVSERITSQTIGVNLAIPYSLQRFELDASVVATQHQTYTNFDFVAQNYNAAWLWSVTPQFHGSLSSSRAESLNAATDSLNPNVRNKNTTQNTALSGIYELGGPWQLTAGASSSNSVNEQALLRGVNNQSSGVNAGVRYVLASGNLLAYSLQQATGSSTNDYTSTTHDVSAVWILSGNTTLNGHVAQISQSFSAVPQYDFSGVAGGVTLVWRLTGKTSLSAGWQRELASFQAPGITHTRTDTLSLSPSWQISPKTSLSLQYRNAVRDDQGTTATPRQDRLQDTSLAFNWLPSQLATLTVALGESSRSSNVINNDFTSHTISFTALFNF